MSLELSLYLIDILGTLHFFSSLGVLIFAVMSLVFYGMFLDSTIEFVQTKTLGHLFLIFTVLSVGTTILIPSQKTMYTILGISTAKEILNNEKVGEIGDKALKVLNKKLDEMIEDKK